MPQLSRRASLEIMKHACCKPICAESLSHAASVDGIGTKQGLKSASGHKSLRRGTMVLSAGVRGSLQCSYIAFDITTTIALRPDLNHCMLAWIT